jgi:hypothetical protein
LGRSQPTSSSYFTWVFSLKIEKPLKFKFKFWSRKNWSWKIWIKFIWLDTAWEPI